MEGKPEDTLVEAADGTVVVGFIGFSVEVDPDGAPAENPDIAEGLPALPAPDEPPV